MISFRSLRHALLMSVATFGGAAAVSTAVQPAYAQEVTRTYNIRAQDLNSALREFAMQTGRDVLYPPEIVAGKRSPGVQGQMTERQALEALLAGSGLRFEQTASNGYAVQDPNSPTRLGDAGNAAPSDDGYAEILVIGQRTLNADIRRSEDDAQPYVVFDREEIERSGARTVEDFLRQRLSASSGYQSATQLATSNQGAASEVTLRGLELSETLILIDGRRSVNAASSIVENQPNLNGIPMAAVDRIEVLPSSAAGIYGGNAVGGVINVILRRDYSGLELTGIYESPADGDARQTQFQVAAGLSLEDGRTNILFAGGISDVDPLRQGDREYIERYRNYLLAVAPNALFHTAPFGPIPLASTTNVHSTNGANLTLKPAFGGGSVGSPFTYVPGGYVGVASDNGAGLIANGGRYNLDLANTAQDSGALSPLTNAPHIETASLTIRRSFTPWLDAFATFSMSDTTTEAIANNAGAFTLTAANPGNPFNQPIRVTTPALGADAMISTRLEDRSFRGGLIFRMPRSWAGALDFGWGQSEFFALSESSQYSSAAATNAIRSGAIDIFRDTNLSQPDFSQFFLFEPDTVGPTERVLTSVSLRLSGPLPFSLPGGAPVLSGVVEHHEETFGEFEQTINSIARRQLTPERSQIVTGAYAEVLLPIVGETNSLPGVNLLELQLAGRWDHYTTNSAGQVVSIGGAPYPASVRVTNELDTVNPSIALRYAPIEGLTMRASYGTAFRPPSLFQIVPSGLPQLTTPPLTDPLRNDEPLQQLTLLQGSGNADLRPESSESLSFGLIFTPRFAPGLRVSLDWSRIEKSDSIAGLQVQFSQDDFERLIAICPQCITRAAPGPGETAGVITAIDSPLLNFARADIEALDLSADYALSTDSYGTFTLSGRATQLLEVSSQLTPDYPVDNRLEFLGNIEWRGSATLTWDYDNWTAAWTTRYFDSYYVRTNHSDVGIGFPAVTVPGTARVPAQTFHDLFVSFDIGNSDLAASNGALQDAEIQFGITNVFDEPPALDLSSSIGAFVSPFGDVRGAAYYLSLRKAF